MINHAAARSALADVLKAALPAVDVHRAGFDSVADFPAVFVGQPSMQPDLKLPYGFDRSTWPVGCVVARPGPDSDAIDQLEELWPQAFAALRKQTEVDCTFGGVCAESELPRATFTTIGIQGKTHPAQLILIDLIG